MTTKVTIRYDCGHSYEWSIEDIHDVNNPTESCPLCRTRLVGEEEDGFE
ncbi:MAG: hypothetical protein ACM3YO_06025 [Bacteroidota bacterium]